MRALWTAATGMHAQQLTLDVIANNLANVQTAGFKRSRVDFQDLVYETLQAPGAAAAQGQEIPSGFQVGHGSRAVATQRLFIKGDLQQTGNSLDLAIEGEGFFQVQLPGGETAYTRAGAFKKNSEGRLVTAEGFTLQPPITIPADAISVTVGVDGTVSVTQAGQTQPQQVGTIELVRFVNPAGLSSQGRNLFLPTQASGDAVPGTPGQDGLGTLLQGFIESSNVNVVEEMVGLITSQRAYEINSRAIRTADEMMQTANNLIRG
ncbi:MAG TPA: flagellar basal-body rod protein FlgG [candidate division Zixibacteria bacterium]|nr:flagellar basal-body rod protein FlgG [candidate division Zixibacteria bacterium]